MEQEEAVKEKLKAIRELMYSSHVINDAQVLELTEDDLFDEQQDENYNYKNTSNLKENISVNEILTQEEDTVNNIGADDSLVSNENAAKSVETLKFLIKKLEKITEESAKINKNITVEEAVHQGLKPLLKDWLNEYLHDVVQKVVDKEVKTLIARKDKTNG
jgi:cell pole-organizing protein PopZ